jgi:hypothetical protein
LRAKRTKNLGWFAFCEAKLRIPTGFQNYFVILKLDSPRTPNGQGRQVRWISEVRWRVAPAPTRMGVVGATMPQKPPLWDETTRFFGGEAANYG